MKKLFVLLSVCAVFAAVSCGKDGGRDLRGQDPDAPEWLYNMELPVPIEFGAGSVSTTATKLDYSVEPDGLFGSDWFRYGVLALDQAGQAHISVNGIEARNAPTSLFTDGVDGMYKTEFVDGSDNPSPHYYPVVSDRNFTFYAYHTFNGSGYSPADLNGNVYENIEVGRCDILWAKAQATPIGSGVGAVEGFNANYIRHLANANNVYLSSANAPRFGFQHCTSRFVFFIQAENDYAESTMTEALVTIDNIKIKGVCLSASMDVTTGVLTATGTPNGELTVNRDETTPFQPVAAGAVWGDPLFVLPSYVENGAADGGIEMEMTIKAFGNEDYVYRQVLRYGGSATSFQPGTSYQFRITVKSYEKIEIVTSVEAWTQADGNDFIIG